MPEGWETGDGEVSESENRLRWQIRAFFQAGQKTVSVYMKEVFDLAEGVECVLSTAHPEHGLSFAVERGPGEKPPVLLSMSVSLITSDFDIEADRDG